MNKSAKLIVLSVIYEREKMTLLIKNGRLVDPKSNRDEVLDILIENDKIVKIGLNLSVENAEIVDATSSYGPTNGISKIGLLYVSDFYFASYSQNNWLSSMNISWLLTPDSSDTIRAYCFYASGSPYARSSYDNNYFVYPAFYLKESITYASGTGTSSDPIRIS